MVHSLKKGRCGRKASTLDLEQLRDIPLKQRMTIEDVSSKLGISKSRIQRYLKKGLLRRHSSSIKPYLTDANKKTTLKWCIDMIVQGLLDDPKFKDLFDFVFIDEKWFYLSQKSERYYLLPEEDEPHRTCKNKNYIPRIMFLCVCARPRFRDGECVFDGKIGCFPLVTFERAIRDSDNRLRGELVIKPIQSITRDVIRDFMINKVLPAIRAKWPREDLNKPIFIQQDNAPSHLKVDDPEELTIKLVHAMKEPCWHIIVCMQKATTGTPASVAASLEAGLSEDAAGMEGAAARTLHLLDGVRHLV